MVSSRMSVTKCQKIADSSLSRDEIWLTLIYELCTSVRDLIHCYYREIDRRRENALC